MVNRLLIFFVALLPLFSLTSCGDDDEEGADALFGQWGVTEGSYYMYYEFYDNGSGVFVAYTDEVNCKASFDWTADDEYIYLSNTQPVYGWSADDLESDGTLIVADGGKIRYSIDGDILWLTLDGEPNMLRRM